MQEQQEVTSELGIRAARRWSVVAKDAIAWTRATICHKFCGRLKADSKVGRLGSPPEPRRRSTEGPDTNTSITKDPTARVAGHTAPLELTLIVVSIESGRPGRRADSPSA